MQAPYATGIPGSPAIHPALAPAAFSAPTELPLLDAESLVTAAYESYWPMVLRRSLGITHDADAAADVAQEAFIRLLREVQLGRTPENIAAWLHRTSRNLAISGTRHAAVERRFAPRLVCPDTPEEPDAATLRSERQHEIEVELAAMSAVDRALLLLAASGATGEEIALHFGLSHGAARTRLTRARARLRARMAVRERAPSRRHARTEDPSSSRDGEWPRT
jgi:RNA polymerase sigma-70 factor, ECF subfamily